MAEKASAQTGSNEPVSANLYIWTSGTGPSAVVFATRPEFRTKAFDATDWLPLLSRALRTHLTVAPDHTYSRGLGYPAVLDARCPHLGTRQGLLTRTGDIDPAPLLPALRRCGFSWLTVNIMPARLPLVTVSGAQAVPYADTSYFAFYTYVSTTSSSPPPVRYTLGYPASWIYRVVGVYALLLLPVLLTLWARRRALQAESTTDVDPAVVWFGFTRLLQWLSIGTWVIWFAALVAFRIDPVLRFMLDDVPFSQWTGLVIWLQYLPALVLVLCSALSHPVFARVRQLELSRGELVRQAFWGQARFLPFVCFGIALFALSSDPRVAMLWVVAGVVSSGLISQAAMKSMGLTPQTLSVGELRDRVFTLAGQAGVKVQQIYVLPAGKGRVANAFAAAGNRVLFTDYLLQHLSKREVDAIVAHELTHLKRRHPLALLLLLIGPVIFVNFALIALGNRSQSELLSGAIYLGGMAAGLFLTYFMSRRFEWVADAGAVRLTGDPEACITGLTKISRLNMTPLQWGKLAGNLLTHPSTLRRMEAIAKLGHLPEERLQELLASPHELSSEAPSAEERYALPSVHGDTPVFSTSVKSSANLRLLWSTLAVSALVPALLVLVAQWQHLEGGALWVAYALGLILTIYARHATASALNARFYRRLERQLRAKLSAAAASSATTPYPPEDALFVGLSPSATPRLYENFSDWDIGFLWFDGDALIYRGEHAQFRLTRQHLTHVESRVDEVSWWNWGRVYISWETQGSESTFALRPGIAGTQNHSRRATQALLEGLEAWRATGEVALDSKPSQAASLSSVQFELPHFGQVTSHSPREVFTAATFVSYALLSLFTTIAVCVFCGLSVNGGHQEGWYVLAVSLLVAFFFLLPPRFYREPKITASKATEHDAPMRPNI